MSIDTDINVHIQKQFEEFQLDGDDFRHGSGVSAAKRIAANIQKHVQILALNNGFDDSGEVFSTFLTPLLTKYIDVALTTEIDPETNDSIERVLNLVAAVAVSCVVSSNGDYSLQDTLDRIGIFSKCPAEKVRSQACMLLASFTCHLKIVKDCLEWKSTFLVAIEALLLQRLTDKSQLVRLRAIQATGIFLASTMQLGTPGLLEPLVWSSVHDPSVANRVEAIRAIPVDSIDTLNHIITRIRDVKEKVRVGAIEKLRETTLSVYDHIMTEEQFCEIVKFGLTERCEITKNATIELICCKFMKVAKFCPVGLMRLMGATTHEDQAEMALRAVFETVYSTAEDKNRILRGLSDPEFRSFEENINKSMIKIEKDSSFDEYQIFYTRIACETAKKSSNLTFSQKEDLMARATPDIPMLCDLFQKHLSRLEELEEGAQETEEQESIEKIVEQEIFVCLELLRLVKVSDLQEEGSRRFFTNTMTNVLTRVSTPDELVEECVEALRATYEDECHFFDAISMITVDINSDCVSDDEQKSRGLLRVILLFSIVLENVSTSLSNHDLFKVMTNIILSSAACSNNMLRETTELSIGALGKIGLFSDESTLSSEFKPLLLNVAANEEVPLECRGQALLSLSDWVLLFPGILISHDCDSPEEEKDLVSILQEILERTTNKSMLAIGAEVAAKLLYSLQISVDRINCAAANKMQSKLLAMLLSIFLDPNNSNSAGEMDKDFGINDVGSPLRLQQILSLFFPAFCLKSDANRNLLLSSIEKALDVAMIACHGRSKLKKRSLVFPLIKVVEYVCFVVMNSETVSMDTAVSETLDKSVTSVTDDGNKLSQIALMTSLQLSRFLVKNEAKLTVTQMRPLCKFLGAQEKDINIDDVRGKKAQLRELKECMDELTYLESSTKKALCPLVELLSNVKEYEDDNDDDERSFDKLFIGDDKSLDESSSNKESDSQSAGDTTVEDEIMLNISRLSLMNKENPPSVVKTYRKSRRSSNQSVLEYIGSPMTNT